MSKVTDDHKCDFCGKNKEEVEKLEQLRWLKNGWQIGCSSVQFKGTEINSPEDVDIWHKQDSQ